MSNTRGLKLKFTVIKNDDMKKYLHENMAQQLKELVGLMASNKELFDDKKPHTYLVINTDEPYADEVIEIMKRYGHWG